MSWRDELQPASLNGVPFGVKGDETRVGRRVAIHEYPMKDKPYVEDMGRATRRLSLVGFLVENSRVYGGGSVLSQRDALIAAAEKEGQSTLVHPTLGRLTVSLPEDGLTVAERWDAGRYMEIRLTVIESGLRVFPSAGFASANLLGSLADALNLGAATDFVRALTTEVNLGLGAIENVLSLGHAVVAAVVGTVADVNVLAGRIARDATSLFNLGSLLTGSYGRYVNANVSSAYTRTSFAPGAPWTVQALVSQGAEDRAAVQTAGGALSAAAAGLDEATVNNMPQAVQALVTSLAAVTPNPGDTINRLSTLATFTTTGDAGTGQVGQAMVIAQNATSALVRRTALAAIGQAVGNYAPSSYDDAAALRATVTGLLDDECTVAGDAGDDASYAALRDLREAVTETTIASGGTLAPLRWWQLQATLPALMLAQRFYQDPTRTDELISQAKPIHPAFMPVRFQALAS